MRLQEHTPQGIEGRVDLLRKHMAAAVRDPVMRQVALNVTHNCPWRDGLCELSAIWHFMCRNIRYTGDGFNYDTFQSPKRTLQFRGGDCLPHDALLLVEGMQTKPVKDIIAGMRIWGRDRWSTVEAVWFKGLLPVDAVKLNNGSWLKATVDNGVFVLRCRMHGESEDDCNCAPEGREVVKLRLGDLRPKMMLLTPARLAFGTETPDVDRTYVEGLFISDGWTSHEGDFDIAGKDGKPKEAQKREVQALCARLGIPTTWFDKSIRVRDAEWSRRMQQMGGRAPRKHALSINLDEAPAAALLRGIMADSGANTYGAGRTFTTTSRELAMQVRLLHKMFGVSCGEAYIEDHGGLGENPIWRLFVRGQRPDGKYKKYLRVAEVHHNVDVRAVYDITTDDHFVYLPEADVTVSNCDDGSLLIATLAHWNGFPTKLRITKNVAGGPWAHIYALCGYPKVSPKQWIHTDWTLGYQRFGAPPPLAGFLEFDKDRIQYSPSEIVIGDAGGW